MVEENWVEENRMIKHSLSWKKHFKYIKTYRLMIYANTLPKIPTEMSVIPVSKEICTSLPAEQRGPISGMKPVPCPLPLQWFDVTGWSSEGRVISESPTETDQSWCFWITGSVGHRHHWTSREPTTLCVFFFSELPRNRSWLPNAAVENRDWLSNTQTRKLRHIRRLTVCWYRSKPLWELYIQSTDPLIQRST